MEEKAQQKRGTEENEVDRVGLMMTVRRMPEEEIRGRLKEAFRRLKDKVDVPPWVADGFFDLGHETLKWADFAERHARECGGFLTTELWFAFRNRALLEDAIRKAEGEKISSEEAEFLQQLLDRFFEIKEDKIRENLVKKCRCKLWPY